MVLPGLVSLILAGSLGNEFEFEVAEKKVCKVLLKSSLYEAVLNNKKRSATNNYYGNSAST